MRGRSSLLVVTAIVTAVAGAFMLLPGEASEQEEADRIRVGVGGDQESLLLGHVMAVLLAAEDHPAEVVTFGRARDARRALVLREVELTPGYSGAVWLDQLGWADPPGDPETSYERVQQAEEQRGVVWLGRTNANATFAFVVAGPPAQAAALESLDDLALLVNTDAELRLCVDPDFATRPDGLEALARIYGIRDEVLANQVLAVPPEEAVVGVARDGCVAGLTTSTDGRAWLAGLRPLADPRRTFPAFVVGAVTTQEALAEHPGLAEALAPFGDALTTEGLAEWNGRVMRGEPVEVVASEAAETLVEAHRRAQEEAEEDAEAG